MPFFPFNYQFTNKWFMEVIERSDSIEPSGWPLTVGLNMINLKNTSESKVVRRAERNLHNIYCNYGDAIFYHGTDAESAESILYNGIDLTESVGSRDFSNGYGFYVTTDLDMAVEWANRKASHVRGKTGAIIAIKISKGLQNMKPHIYLQVNTRRGRRMWEKVVSHFRHGEDDDDLAYQLENINFISGPVSTNIFLHPGEVPTPYNFDQMCILNDDYARKFGSLYNICFVMFFHITH